MPNQALVEQCVEALCKKGCRAVWGDIDALKAGRRISEVQGLSAEEVQLVIAELSAVMAVYEGTCAAS